MTNMELVSGLLAGLGIILLFLIPLALILYVVGALAYRRVLRIYGYDKIWMAWIPYANTYALADAACKGMESMTMFKWEVNHYVFKFYWAVLLVIGFIPGLSALSPILNLAGNVLILGTIFSHIYADVEKKSYEDCIVIGLVSGLIPLIPIVKFYQYNVSQTIGTVTDNDYKTDYQI